MHATQPITTITNIDTRMLSFDNIIIGISEK